MAVRMSCGVEFPNWNPQSEFISDEENSEFQGIFMPMDTLHPEENGDAAGGFAQQSAWPQISLHQNIKKEPKGFLWNPQSEFTSDEEKPEFQGI